MEPRLRERRTAVSRAASRKRLKWLAVVTMRGRCRRRRRSPCSARAGSPSRTSTCRARVQPRDGLDAVVDDLDGANVLRLDTGASRAASSRRSPGWRTPASPREFPHGARIEIRERRPTITYQGADGGYRVLDDHGRVLDVVVGGRPSAYLEVMVDRRAEPRSRRDGAGRLSGRRDARASRSLPPLRARVASVSVDRDGTDLRMLSSTNRHRGPLWARRRTWSIRSCASKSPSPTPTPTRPPDPTHRRLDRRRHPPVRMRRDAAVTCDNAPGRRADPRVGGTESNHIGQRPPDSQRDPGP